MRADRSQIKVILIGAGLAIAVAVPIAALVVEMNTLDREIGVFEVQLGVDRDTSDGLKQLATDVAALRAEVGSISKVITDQSEQAGLIREIGLHIEQEQLADQELQIREVMVDEDYARLPVELNFRGESPAAFRFVRRVEEMSRLVHVKRLKLETSSARDGEVDVELDVEAFFYAPGDPT